MQTLGSFHPEGAEKYQEEVDRACALLSEGDHFHFVFTDRDGTLKSYSCSYPTSIQPAYSAVIQVITLLLDTVSHQRTHKIEEKKVVSQAQFARRCAQFCAIVTTAPLVHIGILNMSTMPEGTQIQPKP